MRRALIIVVTVFCLMGLFPPWVQTASIPNTPEVSTTAVGYHLIFTPPSTTKDGPLFGVQLDLPRLLVQWVVLLALYSGYLFLKGYALAKRRQQ